MRTVRLPKHLGQVDLADLNKGLAAGEICLDWSDVESMLSSKQMAILLSGLQLTAHGEFLGIEMLPPSLQDHILAILLDQEMQQARQQAEKMEHPEGADPALWLPEGQCPDGDATMIKLYLAQQNIGELVLPVDIGSISATLPKHPTAPFASANSASGLNTFSRQKKASAISALSTLVLDMQELAIADISCLLAQVQQLLSAYRAWIDAQEARLQNQTEDLQNREKELQNVLQECRKTFAGIQAGLTLLQDNKEAFQAFCFMNRALWLQRVHTLYAAQRPYNDSQLLPGDVDLPKNRRWQPFQLAFILLHLPALTAGEKRDEHANALADRLWFPDGDGKAEARLALAAYALGLYRLQGSKRGGEERPVVVLRYTARLFRSQQFQSVAALICACEMIRHGNRILWGGIPFRLGLWTAPHIPKNGQLAQTGLSSPAGDPASFIFARLLPTCPWCGSPVQTGKSIEIESYSNSKKRVRRTLLYCGDPAGQCSFSKKHAYNEGLPVLVADEGLDRLLPSLLVATVDKAAPLPWRAITEILFE